MSSSTQTLETITPFSFSPVSQSWEPARGDERKEESARGTSFVRLATYNVLHDINSAAKEWFLQSPKRTQNLVKILCELDADIVCLNEVTISILKVIIADPIIRARYFVSDIPNNDTTSKNRCFTRHCLFGNLILSRLPFVQLYSYSLQLIRLARKVVFGVFTHSSERFSVGAVHTTSMEQNAPRRKAQIEEVMEVQRKYFGDNSFLLGDFNFHQESENEVIEPQLIDLWKATHETRLPSTRIPLYSIMAAYIPYSARIFSRHVDEEEGYTFDAQTNTLLPMYIPFERRRMRLDRLTMRQGANFEPVDKMHRFGTEPIEPGYYLFTSDHYGLYIDMKVKSLSKL